MTATRLVRSNTKREGTKIAASEFAVLLGETAAGAEASVEFVEPIDTVLGLVLSYRILLILKVRNNNLV
jgi:hypothetical protein